MKKIISGNSSNTTTTNKNNRNDKNNKNTTNNNYKKESLKLLIYLIQNSLYKYVYKNNNKNDYNNKLILIDLSKLKLLLNDTKTKDYFILLLSNLKLEYILDLMIYVDKNFINNYIEYSNIRNDIKNDIKEINGRISNNNIDNTRSKINNSLIRHIRRAIKFIKNNLIPLLLLSKLVTDVAKTMLQQSITEIKDNNLNKSKTPTKTTNKFFGIINKLFGNKVKDKVRDKDNNKSKKDKKDIKIDKPEFEYIELDPNILDSMFNNAVIKSVEKVIVVEPKIEVNLSHKDFKDLSFVAKPRTRTNMKDYNLDAQTGNSEGKNNAVSTKASDKVFCDGIVGGENEENLEELMYGFDSNFNLNEYVNAYQYQQKLEKNNPLNPKPSNNNEDNSSSEPDKEQIKPNSENKDQDPSNPNLEEDNSTGDESEKPSAEPEKDSTKNPSDPDKTPPDDDPNKPTKHKVKKPDIGGRGM